MAVSFKTAARWLRTTSIYRKLGTSPRMYFAVTVFSTAGFGDITAKTEAARLVVTGQMIVDLVIIALAVKVIVGAVKRGRSGSQ